MNDVNRIHIKHNCFNSIIFPIFRFRVYQQHICCLSVIRERKEWKLCIYVCVCVWNINIGLAINFTCLSVLRTKFYIQVLKKKNLHLFRPILLITLLVRSSYIFSSFFFSKIWKKNECFCGKNNIRFIHRLIAFQYLVFEIVYLSFYCFSISLKAKDLLEPNEYLLNYFFILVVGCCVLFFVCFIVRKKIF